MNHLYELTNLALLTPQNLVENINLECYSEIKYYKKNNEIICEMITNVDNEKVNYFYYFNEYNQLQRAYAKCMEENIELFDRNKELEILLNEYDGRKESSIA